MKISIVTTNYNTDKYLEQTIQSVLSQKGDFKLEYIIILNEFISRFNVLFSNEESVVYEILPCN